MDNQAAIKQIDGEATSSRAKHIDIKVKHLWNMKKEGEINVSYLKSEDMVADLMTKPTSIVRLSRLKELIGISTVEKATGTQDETS